MYISYIMHTINKRRDNKFLILQAKDLRKVSLRCSQGSYTCVGARTCGCSCVQNKTDDCP